MKISREDIEDILNCASVAQSEGQGGISDALFDKFKAAYPDLEYPWWHGEHRKTLRREIQHVELEPWERNVPPKPDLDFDYSAEESLFPTINVRQCYGTVEDFLEERRVPDDVADEVVRQREQVLRDAFARRLESDFRMAVYNAAKAFYCDPVTGEIIRPKHY